jgi:purine nucleoside permease
VSSDTWWGGARLGARVDRWTRLLTDGKGRYCTTQQEDNATLNALARAAQGGLVDLGRIAVLRSGSDFDRPYPKQHVYASMIAQRRLAGASVIAADNLVLAGKPVVDDIVARWDQWSAGVPADLGH